VIRGRARLSGGLLVVLLAACGTPAETPSPSVAPSDQEPSAEAAVGDLPPGCGQINLRAPDGSRLELDGEWTDTSRDDAATMTWFVRTKGDCFYGVGTVDFSGMETGMFTDPSMIQMYSGTIRSDFTIDGAFVLVGPGESFYAASDPIYYRVPLRIEFTDEGRIIIREQRERNVIGPRCARAEACIPPLVLE
jgi:hypothetical protein